MLLKPLHLFLRSTPFSTFPTSLKWRSETRQRHLASEISSLLLHRSNWIPLLRSHPLPSLTPSLFLQILTRIRSQPETSLRFFNFARSNLNFQPDIHSLSKLIQILIDSSLLDPAKRILNPILRSEPAPAVLDSMIRASSNCKDSRSRVLSFLLESYSVSRLIPNSLETFERIRVLGCFPSARSCNALLDALCSSDQIRTAWVVYAAAVRTGFEPDCYTWSLLARLLCREGKFKKAVGLLDLGFCGVSTYDLIIDCYCKKSDFKAAILLLNQMFAKKLPLRFNTYASILDGGCKFGEFIITDLILKEMIVRELLQTVPFLDYEWVINRLCELEKTFAAEMFYERARNENFKLGKGSYAIFLKVLSKEGRVKEAMRVYRIMLQEGVAMNPSCCEVFLSGICKGEPSEEGDRVLKDLIGKGFIPSVSDLSRYMVAQCSKGRWIEAGDLLNVVLEKGILMDSLSCCSLVKHYCTNGLVDSAVVLHDKIKKFGGCLDVISYNALLEALFMERRIEEAIAVFDHMCRKNVLSSASFVIMISSLCREKELRKAMNLHDEMLKVGLKPDDATYKHLISGFV